MVAALLNDGTSKLDFAIFIDTSTSLFSRPMNKLVPPSDEVLHIGSIGMPAIMLPPCQLPIE